MMMLGREVVLPVDLTFEQSSPSTSEKEMQDYSHELRERLQEVHSNARQKLGLAAQRQGKMYDRNTKLRKFDVGDWVWLHGVPRKRGVCHKLEPKWTGPFLIMNKLSDVIYRIQESSRAKPKVVHVDRLKEYLGPPLQNWQQMPRRNPKRNIKAPARYSDV